MQKLGGRSTCPGCPATHVRMFSEKYQAADLYFSTGILCGLYLFKWWMNLWNLSWLLKSNNIEWATRTQSQVKIQCCAKVRCGFVFVRIVLSADLRLELGSTNSEAVQPKPQIHKLKYEVYLTSFSNIFQRSKFRSRGFAKVVMGQWQVRQDMMQRIFCKGNIDFMLLQVRSENSHRLLESPHASFCRSRWTMLLWACSSNLPGNLH